MLATLLITVAILVSSNVDTNASAGVQLTVYGSGQAAATCGGGDGGAAEIRATAPLFGAINLVKFIPDALQNGVTDAAVRQILAPFGLDDRCLNCVREVLQVGYGAINGKPGLKAIGVTGGPPPV